MSCKCQISEPSLRHLNNQMNLKKYLKHIIIKCLHLKIRMESIHWKSKDFLICWTNLKIANLVIRLCNTIIKRYWHRIKAKL